MKRSSLPVLILLISLVAKAQPSPDTNYTIRVVSMEWIPDGESLLFAAVKFHKTDQKAPFYSRVFRYNLSSRQIEKMMDNAGNIAPSPDGKQIAFLHRTDSKRSDIYIYDIASKKETKLTIDTMGKNSLSWSPDGKKLLYNISQRGMGSRGSVDICVYDITSGQVKQVTQSGKDKSYSPVWHPDSKRIVYYFETGDHHDQIWLTDSDGSFHTNLTNDTSTHNYFPSWLDEKTILYTQNPETIMTMNIDGSNRKKIEGLQAFEVSYNDKAGLFAYVTSENDNKLVLYDRKTKTVSVILDEKGIKALLW